MGLNVALSTLFTPRQIEIIKKKHRGEELTKTEKEVYSRSIKKKILAIRNPDVQRIMRVLLNHG